MNNTSNTFTRTKPYNTKRNSQREVSLKYYSTNYHVIPAGEFIRFTEQIGFANVYQPAPKIAR